jgi:signal transduction histidine kinase
LLNILTVIIISFYSYFRAKHALVERTFDQLTSLRIEKQYRIEGFFDDLIQDIELISKSEDVKNILSIMNQNSEADALKKRLIKKEYNRFLKKHLFTGNDYKRLIISDTSGGNTVFNSETTKIHSSANEQAIINLRKKIIQKSKLIIEDYHSGKAAEQPAIFIGSPVFDANKQIRAIIIMEINIEAINSIMYENNPHNGLGESGESYLVGSDYLMRSTSRFQNNSAFKTKVKTYSAKQALQNITGKDIIRDYRNIKVLSSYGKVNIPGLDWAVLAEIDEHEAMIPIVSIRNNILYLSMIISLFLFAVVYLLAKRISMPIIRLKEAALKMKAGNYNVNVENIGGKDEISDLIVAFNEMSAKINDQTENLKLERSMRLSSMIDGQELERHRLSRELHDGLGQSILAIKMRLERTKNASPERIKEINTEAQELFSDTINEIRNISNNLRPAVLNEFGLLDALTNLCKEMQKSTGIKINVNAEKYTDSGNDKIDTYLYRIAQEALNNIVKHSNTETAEMHLMSHANKIRLCISDSGEGFSYSEEQKICGNGIANMKERVQILNGSIEIISEKEKGTSVDISIPLNTENYEQN